MDLAEVDHHSVETLLEEVGFTLCYLFAVKSICQKLFPFVALTWLMECHDWDLASEKFCCSSHLGDL